MQADTTLPSASPALSRGGSLGAVLREWRAHRRRSQLDLSLDAGVSQRHLSCIESGRSAPGRDLLLRIADALDMPLRDRNRLFLAAGYAPIHPDAGWNEPEMRGITVAVERMLQQQEPYPAVLMDRSWTVLSANRSAPAFFDLFVDMQGRPAPRNLLHLLFDPAGLRPYIRNWNTLAASLLGRVRREAPGGLVDAAVEALIASLLRYPGGPVASTGPAGDAPSGDTLPMIPLSLEKDGVVLNYFSMLCTVGTPTTVAAQELRLECMFPADADTERRHIALMAGTRTAPRRAAPPAARPAPKRRRPGPAGSGVSR